LPGSLADCPPATAVVATQVQWEKERERSGIAGKNSPLAFRADCRNLRTIFTKFWKVEIGGRPIVPQISKAQFPSMSRSEVRCMCNRLKGIVADIHPPYETRLPPTFHALQIAAEKAGALTIEVIEKARETLDVMQRLRHSSPHPSRSVHRSRPATQVHRAWRSHSRR
jgi:hypothetical protein